MSTYCWRYILDKDGNPVPEPDLMKWAEWFEENSKNKKRIVAQDRGVIEGVDVSTVFLALDHNYSDKGLPVLWETMVFGGEHSGHEHRYTSKEDAVAGHAKIKQNILDGSPDPIDF